MKSFAILTSWNLLEVNGEYYIGGTHFTYLAYASQNFDKVYLISSVRHTEYCGCQHNIGVFKNIEVVELPEVNSYLGAVFNYKHYCRALEYVRDKVDFIYSRVPDPFCWLPRLKYGIPTVMHYVGDTIDATLRNEKWSWLKKRVMIAGYLPEYRLTLKASRKARTYTNGTHLRDKLQKKGIQATAVISSTVCRADMADPTPLSDSRPPRMIYVGYLRFAKGMNLLKNLWLKLKETYPGFHFDVVGNGEMMEDVKKFVRANNLEKNVHMHGRIDDRAELRNLLRSADLFVFPSLSEGSPRVVIEAMSEGIPVISTPVGSLPGTFSDGDTIRYFDFDDADGAYKLIEDFCKDPQIYEAQRLRAFNTVKSNFTIERFLSQIYSID